MQKRQHRFRLAAVCMSFIISGCSTLPQSNKVAAFGEAVTAGAVVLNSIEETNKRYAFEIGEEEQAGLYISGKNFDISPHPDVFIDPERIAFRRQVLNALSAYGKALKQAADEGAIQKLEAASVNLGEAAGKLILAASPMASPVVAPAIKVTSRATGYLLGNAYAGEIQSIIAARNDDVQTVVSLLKDDFEILAGTLKIQVPLYEGFKKENLILIRNSRSSNRANLYEGFKSSRQEVDALRAAAEAATQYVTILDAIAEAHNELAIGNKDAAKAVGKLVDLTSDISTLIEATREK